MKLIILHGPPGTGKSTIAERLHGEIPLSLNVELDAWRRFISHYREHRKESLKLAYHYALAASEIHLQAGHDVIVNRVILDSETLDSLVNLGEKYKAQVYEFMLLGDKETILKRIDERGYRPGGLLTHEKAEELWEGCNTFKDERKQAVLIDTTTLTIDEVYEKVKRDLQLT